MDILGQIANPQMANIAQAIDIRQQRVKQQQDALARVEMGRAIAKALPNLQEGTSFRWLAENDPEKFALVSKVLNIPLNDGERFNQYANDVGQLYSIAQADPNQAYAHAQQLIESRKAQGQDTSSLEKWVNGMNEDPMKAMTSLFVMHRSINQAPADPYKQAELDIKRDRLALDREKMERGVGAQQNSPYFQPIQTAEGLYSFDARTGGVAPALTSGGKAVTPAQIDVGLQGQLAGAKTGASEREKVAIDKEKAIATSDKLQVGIDEARKLIPLATGSMLGAARDATLGAAGIATEKSKAASQLETLAGWMVANVPRMEGPQSNFDVENYKTMAAKVGNRQTPIEERIAALDILESLHQKYRGINSPNGENPGVATPETTGEPSEDYLARRKRLLGK